MAFLRDDLAYKVENVNLCQKSFVRLTPGANVIKLFTAVIYECS
jgi:hypothetical protein